MCVSEPYKKNMSVDRDEVYMKQNRAFTLEYQNYGQLSLLLKFALLLLNCICTILFVKKTFKLGIAITYI